jgi:ABC-type lipoprotein export system ATPase subunit
MKQKDAISEITDAPDQDNDITLKDIHLQVKQGEFICVMGDVASGKSSLLHAILGDMLYITEEEAEAFEYEHISDELKTFILQKKFDEDSSPVK